MLFGSLLTGTLLAAFAFLVGLVFLLKGQLIALFPPHLVEEATAGIQVLILEQAVALLVFTVVLLSFLTWFLGRMVVTPLRGIIEAMDAYATSGQQIPLPDVSNAPKELQTLSEVFQRFVATVETSHRHDEEISRVKSDFISTAAHQFRTPLTGIRWALEALEQENLTEQQKALVKNAKDKSHDLVGIVKTLLDISAIESGKYKYDMTLADAGRLVADVTRDFAPLAGQSRVSLFYAATEASLPKVRIDKERVKWVLNNLIENAIRYTPAGGTVRVSADATLDRVFIRVQDTGIGIQPEDRGNIFSRFYRASNAISKQNQGNGLGLYISRAVARDHGGDLNFAPNENGPGTTFILSLPVA